MMKEEVLILKILFLSLLDFMIIVKEIYHPGPSFTSVLQQKAKENTKKTSFECSRVCCKQYMDRITNLNMSDTFDCAATPPDSPHGCQKKVAGGDDPDGVYSY